jgi:hypothetical protein
MVLAAGSAGATADDFAGGESGTSALALGARGEGASARVNQKWIGARATRFDAAALVSKCRCTRGRKSEACREGFTERRVPTSMAHEHLAGGTTLGCGFIGYGRSSPSFFGVEILE